MTDEISRIISERDAAQAYALRENALKNELELIAGRLRDEVQNLRAELQQKNVDIDVYERRNVTMFDERTKIEAARDSARAQVTKLRQALQAHGYWEDVVIITQECAVITKAAVAEKASPKTTVAHQPETRKTDCGHGHVWPNPHGLKARCGGPGLCPMCALDAANKAAMEQAAEAGDPV
jgi:hypothetical protein